MAEGFVSAAFSEGKIKNAVSGMLANEQTNMVEMLGPDEEESSASEIDTGIPMGHVTGLGFMPGSGPTSRKIAS